MDVSGTFLFRGSRLDINGDAVEFTRNLAIFSNFDAKSIINATTYTKPWSVISLLESN